MMHPLSEAQKLPDLVPGAFWRSHCPTCMGAEAEGCCEHERGSRHSGPSWRLGFHHSNSRTCRTCLWGPFAIWQVQCPANPSVKQGLQTLLAGALACSLIFVVAYRQTAHHVKAVACLTHSAKTVKQATYFEAAFRLQIHRLSSDCGRVCAMFHVAQPWLVTSQLGFCARDFRTPHAAGPGSTFARGVTASRMLSSGAERPALGGRARVGITLGFTVFFGTRACVPEWISRSSSRLTPSALAAAEAARKPTQGLGSMAATDS